MYILLLKQVLVFFFSVEKLSSVFTLLEAFGNSRTLMNTTATRFTQFFTLDFDSMGQIAAASIQVMLLYTPDLFYLSKC